MTLEAIGQDNRPKLGWPNLASDLHVVDLWCWSLGHGGAASCQADAAILSDEERQRAACFVQRHHVVAYVEAHAQLRRVLGAMLGRRAETLRFLAGPEGKPRLAPDAAGAPLHFNLSHTEGLAVLAVTTLTEVGVDVERVRPVDFDVAERFFSASEREALRLLPQAERPAGFFNAWTRKEAYLKALGCGLTRPLDGFDVSLSPYDPPRLLRVAGAPAEAVQWRIAAFVPAAGHVGAVALRGVNWRLRCHDGLPPSPDHAAPRRFHAP